MNQHFSFRMFAALAVGVTFLFVAGTASAQNSATEAGQITADILDALSLTPVDTLNFGGTVADTLQGGTVTVAPDGSVTSATLTHTGGHQAGSFTVQGAGLASVDVTFDATTTISNGANNMTVDNFVSSDNPVNLDASGNGSFTVGADLAVTASQATGTYTGTYDATVTYQ